MEIQWQRVVVGSVGALLVLLVWLALPAGSVSGNSDSFSYETDQIVIKLEQGYSVEEVNATYGTSTIRPLLNSAGIYLLQRPDGFSAEAVVTQMNDDSRLLYAELNYIGVAPEAFSADSFAWPDGGAEGTEDSEGDGATALSLSPRVTFEWEPDPGDSARYYHQPAVQALNLDQAHVYHTGTGVTVALLDTGVDLNHGALSSSLAAGYDFVDDDPWPQDSANGLDDDGDGYVDEVAGHGTHVAGIIHLVAPDSRIMPLRVLDSDGQGNSFVIAEAMLYAVDHGAEVINMSLGTLVRSVFLEDVLQQVTAGGAVVVGASGNLNSNVPQYPAAFACALGITALNRMFVRDELANFGTWVDLSAPGERIYSTYPGGEFAWWSGTSMATPFVAGQAALLHGFDGALSPAGIGRLIAATAHSTDQQNPDYAGLLGAGRVDIGASLAYLAANPVPTSAPELMDGCGP